MCSALPYAKSLPINHPIISPSLATPELLRGLPPLMLVRPLIPTDRGLESLGGRGLSCGSG